MISRTTSGFRDCLATLPAAIRVQARQAYRLFEDNPAHPGLHFKKVNTKPPVYSARVGIHYRALGVIKDQSIIWFWIGTHAEYDLMLEQM